MPTKREVLERPVPPELQPLHDGLQPLSGIMMRQSLALRGLTLPAVLAVPQIARHVVYHVEEEHISLNDARELILDCREHSNKRVYLYRADPSELQQWRPPEGAPVVAARCDVTLADSPEQRLQYVYVEGSRARVVMSEGHTTYDRDVAALSLIPRVEQKLIVIDADLATGDVALMMDPPGQYNPHGTRIRYKGYYEQRMGDILGAAATPVALGSALDHLEDQQLLEIHHSRAETTDGLIALTGRTTGDVRQHAEFAQLRARRVARDEDEFVWLPQPAQSAGGLTIPLRPLKTYITARAGEVRFALHAMRCEIEYVLDKLRTNS